MRRSPISPAHRSRATDPTPNTPASIQLPHRTGTRSEDDLSQDEIVGITRATLVKLSATSIVHVLDALLGLLTDLARPYTSVAAHPTHVLLSEFYILALVADCCAHHWASVGRNDGRASPPSSDGGFTDSLLLLRNVASVPAPQPLPDALVTSIFEFIKLFFGPLPDGYVLPAKTLLDETPGSLTLTPGEPDGPKSVRSGRYGDDVDSTGLLDLNAPAIEAHVKTVVEFVTATSWPAAFDYFRNVIYTIRATAAPTQGPPISSLVAADEERSALVILRLVAYFWVDANKLGQMIQELCSSFLHFRKHFQNTVAVVAPLLISRWLDRFPDEFVQLHTMHKRLDGGADTLFDMTHTVVDNARRRALLYPLQTTLLLLLPDVFEVASNLREAKSGSMSKKVGFLDSLRKALRNRNEQAAYCLVSLLRATRHFNAESDSALLSYAMDVQDEVRDAVFRKVHGADASMFDQDILTAAFVSLAHLNFDICVESLCHTCLAPTAPHGFRIAVIQTCSHFARLRDNKKYLRLFTAASPFIQSQLTVSPRQDIDPETSSVKELTNPGCVLEKTISLQFTEMLLGSRGAWHRRSDHSASIIMICNILDFLNASPMTLFSGSPDGTDERNSFFEDNFESLFSCMVVADEAVRQAAVGVAKRLFAEEHVLESLKASKRLESRDFKQKFWRLTWVASSLLN